MRRQAGAENPTIPGSPRLFSMMGAPIRNDEAGMRPVRTTCQNDMGEKSLTPGGHDGLDLVLIDADLLARLSENLGEAMVGINEDEIETIMAARGE